MSKVDLETAEFFQNEIESFKESFAKAVGQPGTGGGVSRPQRMLFCDQATAFCNQVRRIKQMALNADDVESCQISADDLMAHCKTEKDIASGTSGAALFGCPQGKIYSGVEPHLVGSYRLHLTGTRLMVCIRASDLREANASPNSLVVQINIKTPILFPLNISLLYLACYYVFGIIK